MSFSAVTSVSKGQGLHGVVTNVPNSLRQLEAEEQLFYAVVLGSPDQYRELLKEVRDVDMKNCGQRTLLHLAVRVGSLKWVEALLMLGSDPGIRDGEGATVLAVAEEMRAMHPGEKDRQGILKLIQFVFVRESKKGDGNEDVIRRKEGLSSEAGGLSGEIASFSATQEEIRAKLDSLGEDVQQYAITSSADSSRLKEDLAALSSDLKGCLEDIRLETATITRKVDYLGDKMDAIRREMKASINAPARQFFALSDEVKEVKRELITRDAVLQELEGGLETLSEEWYPFKKSLKEVRSRVKDVSHDVEDLKTLNSGMIQSFSADAVQGVRSACIDSMLSKTSVLDPDDRKISQVKGYYENLYDASTLTSGILLFLQFQSSFGVSIDCDSRNVGRMKDTLRDHNGVEVPGEKNFAFADLEEGRVYLGGGVDAERNVDRVAGLLAKSLARMAIHLTFGNGGKPYSADDPESRRVFEGIVEEAEGRVEREGMIYDEYIRYALSMKTQAGKEVVLISSVPGMIAEHGSIEGTARLRRQLPSLVSFYERHVMLTMLGQAELASLR